MLGPRSLLPALVAGLLAPAGLLGAAPASADQTGTGGAQPAAEVSTTAVAQRAARPRAPEYDAPLELTIDQLTPSLLGRDAPITLTGEVTNTTDVRWTAINVYPFASWNSRSPRAATTTDELATETSLPADEYTGDRYTSTANNPSGTIPSLAPGESAAYVATITAEQARQVSGAGVYWVGVHALGESPDSPRDDVADGKSRTFMPLVRGGHRAVPFSLVLSLRGRVAHDPDGAVAQTDLWAERLGPSGRLSQLMQFGQSASVPVTWLVDPAVLDAVEQLSRGNPGRSLSPTLPEQGQQQPNESPSGSESATSGATPEQGAPVDPDTGSSDQGSAVEQAVADNASAFLEQADTALAGQELLLLPFGDLDVAGAYSHDPAWVSRAIDRSGTTLQPLGLEGRSVVAPPSGRLDEYALSRIPDDSVALTSDRNITEEGPALVSVAGRDAVVYDESVALGGPGPSAAGSAIAMRQQILSTAALHSLDGGQPLVVVLPPRWAPPEVQAETEAFFGGLDVPWLSPGTLADIESGRAVEAELRPNPTPTTLSAYSFAAAQELSDRGRLLDDVLYRNDTVGAEVTDEALANLSAFHRFNPLRSTAASVRSRDWISDELDKIELQPTSVTLSSDQGSFNVTVVNGMGEPVEIQLQAAPDSDSQVEIAPSKVLRLQSEDRSTQLMQASTTKLGRHEALLQVTTKGGDPVGTGVEVPVLANQVSDIIWVVVGVGVVLLFGTIVLRLFRRLRAAWRARRAETA